MPKHNKGLNIFQRVAMRKPKESTFNLSHDVKTSFNMGELIPTNVMDILPGDKVSINVENMLRFAPLVSPVMHKVKVQTHYFFVPNRLLWAEWDTWITGDSDVEAPYVDLPANFVVPGTIGDYLGIINDSEELLKVSPMALAAYFKIYDEYFRDQNLVDTEFIPLVAGDNSFQYRVPHQTQPLRRAWMHDYFTSCLPFAQKGEEAMIPIGDFNDVPLDFNALDGPTYAANGVTGAPIIAGSIGNWESDGPDGDLQTTPSGVPVALDVTRNHTARTSDLEATTASVTNLRRAFRLQEWLERNARGGTRYVENILSHFGVRSKDERLNRPEYIGGSRQGMTISEVLATAQTELPEGQVPIGQMAGHGISVGGGNTINYTATEHGFIMGIISVMPETAYQQGVQKMHHRFDRLDYAWPTFAHIGEQPVLGKEIYAGPGADAAYLDGTFGYIPRYSEYRYQPSRVSGDMRDTLAYWHLGRIFGTPPQLNEDFISCDPSRRIFALTDGSATIYAHIFNNVTARRKLPKYGTPMF